MILVTGGAGFIGSQTVRQLLLHGHKVRVLDNFSTGKRDNLIHLGDEVDILEGDIRDTETIHEALKGVSAVIHLAAQVSVQFSVLRPETSYSVNSSGFFNILNEIRKSGKQVHVVFASSAAVYGNKGTIKCNEQLEVDPMSPYALEKYINEKYAELFKHIYGINSIGLRYFNVYGSGQDPNSSYSGVVSKMVNAAEHKKRFVIYGDGTQSRDFVHVNDVALANVKALTTEFSGVINIAAGKSTSLNELINIIKDSIGYNIDVEYGKSQVGDIKYSLSDITLAKKVLNYKPTIGIREGIKNLLCSLTSCRSQ
ncbi:NAD-dependent epimerase/dehydratase family protein [Paenibacillus campinasensis]|uniref:UDP-glucose 4-epimerase n=1 Tax=Paenibacillus campinasensis TaxID=66347 RepID=A0ABW9T511_9BACL|nr:NAD-dependent epimerase/dehydratase family protein [Paenibacillus campinasensis]MUG68379.1 NAD-dependent epimerase/dehydratase family protein [Paenibacillus campinasensis]